MCIRDSQYTVLQQREIAWLREQRFDNLEFRELESLDRIRSDLGGGNTYDGDWSASGKQEGTGEMVDSAGTRYTGEWKNGERCGQGVETRKDGRTYTGEWLADKMHGTPLAIASIATKFVPPSQRLGNTATSACANTSGIR